MIFPRGDLNFRYDIIDDFGKWPPYFLLAIFKWHVKINTITTDQIDRILRKQNIRPTYKLYTTYSTLIKNRKLKLYWSLLYSEKVTK